VGSNALPDDTPLPIDAPLGSLDDEDPFRF
jgi:hypothetical protein